MELCWRTKFLLWAQWLERCPWGKQSKCCFILSLLNLTILTGNIEIQCDTRREFYFQLGIAWLLLAHVLSDFAGIRLRKSSSLGYVPSHCNSTLILFLLPPTPLCLILLRQSVFICGLTNLYTVVTGILALHLFRAVMSDFWWFLRSYCLARREKMIIMLTDS